jgi:hypothetical protein
MKGNAQEASIHAVMGSSGGGKTTRARGAIMKRKRRRTMIWSPKEDKDRYADWWPGSVVCTTIAEVLAIVRAAGKRGEFHIVFKPSLERKRDEAQFDVFCRIAYAAENLLFLVDELHTVTRPGWAGDGWSKLVMMGRANGIEIWGLSQRPANMDKNFLGNCTTVHTRRLSYPDDAKTVAKSLGVAPGEVSALTGYMWIERNNMTGEVTRG